MERQSSFLRCFTSKTSYWACLHLPSFPRYNHSIVNSRGIIMIHFTIAQYPITGPHHPNLTMIDPRTRQGDPEDAIGRFQGASKSNSCAWRIWLAWSWRLCKDIHCMTLRSCLPFRRSLWPSGKAFASYNECSERSRVRPSSAIGKFLAHPCASLCKVWSSFKSVLHYIILNQYQSNLSVDHFYPA